jgi:hypothetical protein
MRSLMLEFRNLERFLFWVADRFVLRYKLE